MARETEVSFAAPSLRMRIAPAKTSLPSIFVPFRGAFLSGSKEAPGGGASMLANKLLVPFFLEPSSASLSFFLGTSFLGTLRSVSLRGSLAFFLGTSVDRRVLRVDGPSSSLSPNDGLLVKPSSSSLSMICLRFFFFPSAMIFFRKRGAPPSSFGMVLGDGMVRWIYSCGFDGERGRSNPK